MDWIPDFVKGHRLQGAALGLLGALVLFLALTPYDIKEFNAFGFHVALPDSTKAEKDQLQQSLQKAQSEAATAAAELAEAKRALEMARSENTGSAELSKTRESELTKVIDQQSAKIAELAAQSKSDSDDPQMDQLRAEIASLRKQRDALSKKVDDLTALLGSKDKALADANKKWAEAQPTSKSEKLNSCGLPEAGIRKTFSKGQDEHLDLLEGKFRLRLKAVSSPGYAYFYSNLSNVDEIAFAVGESIRLKFGDTCTYVFRVESVTPQFGSTVILFFSL